MARTGRLLKVSMCSVVVIAGNSIRDTSESVTRRGESLVMTTDRTTDRNSERRNYFRVDDEVILQYRQVLEDAARASSRSEEGAPADGFNLGSRFAALSQGLIPLMRTIKSESATTARYLAAIDKKLDILAQVLLKQELAEADNLIRKVNLGAGGIAFISKNLLETGSFLELRMILLPEMIGLTIFGQVVVSGLCESDSPGLQYRTAVEFVELHESDRDLIVSHVRRREQEVLRKERGYRRGP